MSDGPFKLKDFYNCEITKDAVEKVTELANVRYHELHPPVSEGMRFTAEDFIEYSHTSEGRCLKVLSTNKMAEKANAKLQRILAQGVRVWGPYITSSGIAGWFNKQSDEDTHQGIVINIEEIP